MESTQEKSRKEVKELIETENVVIRFSGDSGDGMQLTGTLFSDTSAFFGNDICTFPDYPSEIRAPLGTIAGVSGFQIQFGSREICTSGDTYDVLVAMNAAALKVDLKNLKCGGIIIANTQGFDKKNLRLAQYPDNADPLTDSSLAEYKVFNVDIVKHTKECLSGTGLGNKEIERSKNMFVLGLLYWMFDKPMEHTETFITEKFAKKPEIAEGNLKALHAGWNYGENTEIFVSRYRVAPATLPKGKYRSISGNHAAAIALITASEKSGLPLFLGSYPITPASDILHELSSYKANGVKTFQAEDEIGGICSSIGASYAGSLAVTTTSGPGLSLKIEAMGLATILELPLVIIDVQRGGPSTGLPTKTEQADLFQVMFGRHGEAPLPVLAASSPADCFETVYESCRIALEHMTPVICLTDGYIANGSEPWKFPTEEELPVIKVKFADRKDWGEDKFLPYKRDERLSRPWAIPGTPGLEHRIGGLEKKHETGAPSHDADNHEFMVKLRQEKVNKIAGYIPRQEVALGKESGKLAVLTWGSTYGTVRSAVSELIKEGHEVSHIHLKYLNPFPSNLEEMLRQFAHVLIPEMNNGQLSFIIRGKYLLPVISYNKIKGIPFSTDEIKNKVIQLLNSDSHD